MAIALKTRYITVEEFKQYFGVDIESKLNTGESDNLSNSAISFIMRVEDRMDAWLNSNYFQNVEVNYPQFSEYQKRHYKLALLEQTMYILRNGDLSTDSGYDPEAGVIASINTLKELSISPTAKDHLLQCGLLSRHIGRRGVGNANWWL